jgi:hypothetical protein
MMGQRAKPIILDGLGLVTFDGQGTVQAIAKEWKTDLTIQRCHFIHCRTEDTGAAIRNTNFDGSLTVIDCTFVDCKATKKGPDIGGGAIGVRGQRPLLVSNCSFKDCDASNGGAINTIQCEVYLIDCSFEDCDAFGFGGGADQGPVGQGGIGGAVYCDTVNNPREGWEYFISGCLFTNNSAGDHAGAMFAYNNDKKGGHIFWNCHFERNVVGKDARIKHGGAIYTQNSRHLWMGNCSFHDNVTPGIGVIFTAANVREEFINCEFGGNKPEFKDKGTNIVMRKTQALAWIAGLGGRMPGPIGGDSPAERKKKAAEEKERARLAAKEKKSVPFRDAEPNVSVDAEARERFSISLRERCILSVASGRFPEFTLSSMRSPATIEGADADQASVSVGGSALQVTWRMLTDSDRAGIALWLARSQEPIDQANAAFWLRLTGRDEDAKVFRARSGDFGDDVDLAFR